jgi:hypothetical protein
MVFVNRKSGNPGSGSRKEVALISEADGESIAVSKTLNEQRGMSCLRKRLS